MYVRWTSNEEVHSKLYSLCFSGLQCACIQLTLETATLYFHAHKQVILVCFILVMDLFDLIFIDILFISMTESIVKNLILIRET